MALILDIHEQYLHEAEFLFETWDASLDSPSFVLDEVLEGPEQRLVTQIDGLVSGGPRVIDEVLLPVLDEADDDEHRTRAACLTVLVSGSIAACEAVVAALEQVGPVGFAAIVRALGLAPREGLASWLARELGRFEGPALAGRLAALAGQRLELGPALLGWLASADPAVSAAAARLARASGEVEVVRSLVALLRSPDPATRGEALLGSLLRGVAGCWPLVHEWARASEDPLYERCRRWLALAGDEAAHAWLIAEARASPSTRALTIAGLTGRVAAAELAVELLEHESLARLAGEVLGVIAGLPVDDDRLWLDTGAPGELGEHEDDALPELDDDDLDADLVPAPEQLLRLPDPVAVRAWWSERRSQLDPTLRHREGLAFESRYLRGWLLGLPTRRRHALAEEVLLRSGGRIDLDTRTWVRVQQARLLDTTFDVIDPRGPAWH